MIVARGGVYQHLNSSTFSSTGGRWSDSQVLVLVKDHKGYMTHEDEVEVDRLMGVLKEVKELEPLNLKAYLASRPPVKRERERDETLPVL